jgi:hypothetical protein
MYENEQQGSLSGLKIFDYISHDPFDSILHEPTHRIKKRICQALRSGSGRAYRITGVPVWTGPAACPHETDLRENRL